MPDDKKPARPPVPHRDYTHTGRKTPALGMAAITPTTMQTLTVEATTPERGDVTPTPVPGSITNEDLAVRIRDVDKKHDDFATVTTRRLAVVEARVERVPAVEKKVDKLLMMSAEKQQKQELLTMDITRAHVEVETKEKVAGVEVTKEKQLLTLRDEQGQKDYERKLKLRVGGIVGTICTIVATLVTILAHHC